MTEDQLSQAKKLKTSLTTIEKALERVSSLQLSWAQNGTVYHFSRSELNDNQELVDLFVNVKETAKTLLEKQLEKQLEKLTNEFKKL